MKSRLPLVLALVGVFGAGLTTMAIDACADPVAPPPADQAPPDLPDHFKLTDADRAAFLDARVAALHAGLELTPAQEKLWPAVESALRDTHKVVAAQCEARHSGPRPADPVAWLQRVSANAVARGEALKKLADAAAPLYAALSDDQKHRLPFLIHAGYFHFGRFAENMMDHGGAMDMDMMKHHGGMGMDKDHTGGMEMNHDDENHGPEDDDQ